MNRGFFFLNVVQFLDALNENLFKYIVVFFLIYELGDAEASNIMAISGAVFIMPFVLFSSYGGVLADRFSKTRIMRLTRSFWILFAALALWIILQEATSWIYPILFVISSLAAIFGPSKYGSIPELVSENQLVKANAYIAAFTFFGIILGTAIASGLDTITHQNYPWMVSSTLIIAFIGWVLSFFIPWKGAAQPSKHCPAFIYREVFDALVEMKQIPHMILAVFCYSYFLFVGAFVQMNIVPYSIERLQMSPVTGGYLFLFSSIGVGIGSLIASRLSGKLHLLPFWGLGMSLGFFLFTFISQPFWINIIWLIMLGVFGGLFLVPPQAYILGHSKPENKGRNIATANFLSFVGALIAALVLFILNTLLHQSPEWSFASVGVINTVIMLAIFWNLRVKKQKAQ